MLSFRDFLRGNRERWPDKPIAVISTCLATQQLLFSRPISQISPHQIPVFLRLQQWYEMYPRPHLLPRKLIVFAYAPANLYEAVCHDQTDAEEVDRWSEAARWEIAFVLDGIIAARRRHVLRHGCGGRAGLLFGQGVREHNELAREKMWSRIYLTPLLQAEEDRDQVRRHLAQQKMEEELLGKVTPVYNSDKFVRPTYAVVPSNVTK